jgi:hypothetical protein
MKFAISPLPRLPNSFWITLAFLGVSLFHPFASPTHAWYDHTWRYRKSITVDATKVVGTGDHTDFPVLILLASDTDLSAHAQSDFDDILFTNAADEKLDHEIESYNAATGALTAWVEIDTLDFDNDTIIYLYYGNSFATNQQDAAGTWNSGYVAVWHLNEDVTDEQTTGSHTDSTSYGHTGTQNNNVEATGVVANGQDFDANADYITVGDQTLLDFEGSTEDFTILAWVNRDTTGNSQMVLAKLDAGNDGYSLGFNANNTLSCRIDTITPDSTSTLTDTTNFHQVGCTMDRDGNGQVYLDGAADGSPTSISGAGAMDTTASVDIGRESGATRNFDGIIDEVRLYAGLLTTDWIQTEYNNYSDPGSFYSLGTQEDDARLQFTVSAVAANQVHNDITTSEASTFASLPFSNLTFATPKYVAHSLNVSTNSTQGYYVTTQMTNYLQGIYPGNIIDPFIATWNNPTTWTQPTGLTPNVNTGWIGANTTDTRVTGWGSATQKFGPLDNTARIVMYSSTPDLGTTIYVTYALEVNIFQPADSYSGTIVYNILARY